MWINAEWSKDNANWSPYWSLLLKDEDLEMAEKRVRVENRNLFFRNFKITQ